MIPRIRIGDLNLETILAVVPVKVDTTIHFALISFAKEQVAWLRQSVGPLWINSELLAKAT